MLASDCFSVSLFDSGGDGLSFWNNPSQGNGYFRILNANNGIAEMSFNPDFGDNIYQQFTTGFTLPVLELNEPIRAFNIYPNPASDIINTEFSMPLNSQVKIQLVNMLGEIVLSREVMVTQSLEKYSLDVTTVENGIYYVLAESRSFKETRKVVIAR